MHFCVLTARLYGRVPAPRKTSLNWFMPAFVNSKVGSSSGTTLDDGTNVWPCFLTKKSMNCWRISFAVNIGVRLVRGGRDKWNHQGITVSLAVPRSKGGKGDEDQLQHHEQEGHPDPHQDQ